MFSWAHIRTFSLELFHIIYYIYICLKECNLRKFILVQGFCPLKIKITQFPYGFRVNFFFCFDLVVSYFFLSDASFLHKQNKWRNFLQVRYYRLFLHFSSTENYCLFVVHLFTRWMIRFPPTLIVVVLI